MSARRPRSAAAIVALALLKAGAAHGDPLSDVLTAAYRNSPQILAARDQLRATNERVPEALAATRPTVTFNGTAGTVHETSNGPIEPSTVTGNLDQGYFPTNLPRTSYGVTVTEQLYRGGQTLAQFRGARAQVRAQRATVDATEGQVLVRAASDFADLAQAQEQLRLAQRRLDTATSDLAQAQGRYDGGALTRTDLAQSEAARADVMGQRAQAVLGVERARAALERDTTVRLEEAILPDAAPAPTPTTRDEAIRLAQENSATVRQARFALEAARQDVRVSQGKALPNLSVQGVVEHQDGTNFRGEQDDIRAVILQLRAPLYSGGSLAAATRAARATADARDHDLQLAQLQAQDSADEAWSQLESAEAAITAYASQAQINAVALTGVRIEASTGERTVQDILVAELALYQSQLRLVEARHDAFVAKFNLAAAVGSMSARTLKLPPPYYDPERDYDTVHLGPGR